MTADVHVRYVGTQLADHSFTPGSNPSVAPTRVTDTTTDTTKTDDTTKTAGDGQPCTQEVAMVCPDDQIDGCLKTPAEGDTHKCVAK